MNRIHFNALDGGVDVQLLMGYKGLGPMHEQSIHAGLCDKVWVFGWLGGFKNCTMGVQNPHSSCTPGFDNRLCSRNFFQGFCKACVSDGEVLSTFVKTAKGRILRRHASTRASAFLKHLDIMPCFDEGSGCSNGRAFWRVAQFRVARQISSENDFIEVGHGKLRVEG